MACKNTGLQSAQCLQWALYPSCVISNANLWRHESFGIHRGDKHKPKLDIVALVSQLLGDVDQPGA